MTALTTLSTDRLICFTPPLDLHRCGSCHVVGLPTSKNNGTGNRRPLPSSPVAAGRVERGRSARPAKRPCLGKFVQVVELPIRAFAFLLATSATSVRDWLPFPGQPFSEHRPPAAALLREAGAPAAAFASSSRAKRFPSASTMIRGSRTVLLVAVRLRQLPVSGAALSINHQLIVQKARTADPRPWRRR